MQPQTTEPASATEDGEASRSQEVPRSVRETIRILIAEDEHTLGETCASFLREEGYDVTLVDRGDEARDLLRKGGFDIALLDLYMGKVQGLELMQVALEKNQDCLPILMTGNPSVETSVEGIRKGAWDYVPKPFSATHLQILMGRASHTVVVARESRREREALRGTDGDLSAGGVELLGRSPAFLEAVALARKVARTDASVFLTGESGAGKEVFAQFIHHNSRRSSRELVPVNCAAIPESLLESEMFGHMEGAFTGAIREKPGLLEVAHGGTLFLDEVTEMPASVQAKLLRVIQDGVVRKVGSTQTDAVVNVRFIAATNHDPGEAVRNGTLRRDLHYRLRVVPIEIPPLRARPEDIDLLSVHFLEHFWQRHRGAGEPVPTLSEKAVEDLRHRTWRGNVRELKNVIEHAVVLADPGSALKPEDLPDLDDDDGGRDVGLDADVFKSPYHESRERVMAEFEERYLRTVIRRGGGNISSAARIAGVDRTTLYRLMEKHDVSRDELIGETSH